MRKSGLIACFAGASVGLGSLACAQSFVNGNFQTGDATGWTIANTSGGTGAPGTVELVDIDGPGPLGDTFAARFSAGRAAGVTVGEHGVDLTQMLSLTQGVAYTIEFDCAALRTITSANASGGNFSVIVDGVIQGTTFVSGSTSSTAPHYAHVSATFTPATTGLYAVGGRATRPFTVPTPTAPTLFQNFDNFVITGGGPAPCYANCDASTVAPILNVNDFTCFINEYAAASSYANCDLSTTAPVLNVNDFTCFINQYAAGCP